MRKVLFALLAVLVLSCRKHDSPETDNKKNELFTFEPTFQPKDSLVGIFNWGERGAVYSFFGTRDPNGNLGKINTATLYLNSNPDTVYNFLLDDSLRVTTLFRTIKDVKDTIMIRYSYADTLTTITLYGVSWGNNKLIARHTLTVNSQNVTAKSFSSYRMMGTLGSPNVEKIKSVIQATIFAALLIYVAAPVAEFIAVTGALYYLYTQLPNIIIITKDILRAAIGAINFVLNAIFETLINLIPDKIIIKINPLDLYELYGYLIGSSPSSGLIPFNDTAPPNCQYTVEYSNTSIFLYVNPLTSSVEGGEIKTRMTEAVVSCPHGITPPHNNIYTFSSATRVGTSVVVVFNDGPLNYPPNNVKFTGTINNSSLNGTINLVRTSYPPAVVNIPVSLTR
jgi:hypothetical protein